MQDEQEFRHRPRTRLTNLKRQRMGKLTDSLQQLLLRQINERGMVVWYDPEKAYTDAIEKLSLPDVTVLPYEDGFFRLREKLEPLIEWVDGDGRPRPDGEVPPRLLIYVPMARAASEFALIEIETAGAVVEPGAPVTERNTRLAAFVERVFASVSPEKAGHVARQVEEGLLTFEEVEQMADEAGSAATGALRLIFGHASPVDVLLGFAASAERDAKIVEKNAVAELAAVATEEIGLPTTDSDSPEVLRRALCRHLLLGELALALPAALRTAALDGIALPEKAVQRETIGHLCKTWRNRLDLQEAYAATAEDLELAAALAQLELPAASVREVETFAAIERLLIRDATEQLLTGGAEQSAGLATVRRGSFWSRRAPELLLQWSLVEVAASLLRRTVTIRDELKKQKWTLDELIAAYSHHANPWLRLDREARHLESRYARFDFDPGTAGADWEKVMARCRNEYLTTLDRMTESWTRALEAAAFSASTCSPQSQTFKEHVGPLLQKGVRTAYLLVDALRFEMAAELLEGLSSDFELQLEPALGQLPGITPVGMAALMPGAEQGLALERQSGKLHVCLSGKRVTDRVARMSWLQEKTGAGTAVVKLGEIVRLTPKKKKELVTAKLVVVTSQEIDRLGEERSEEDEARLYMDDVLEKLRRGIRNLAHAGVQEFVVAADHGFIFAEGFESSLKMDDPGGETAELHARVWIGEGGTNAGGFFRVPASSLELGGSMETAFPRSLGTFKVKGGTGAYFHGGASLQEQLIPVARLTSQLAKPSKGAPARVIITLGKKTITNRFFSVTLALESDEMFVPEQRRVRVEVVAGKDVAGSAAMAAYGFEEGTKEVTLKAGEPNAVTLMLIGTGAPNHVSLKVIDSETELPLAVMNDITVNLAL
jgi:hypothetical protein